MKWLAVLDMDGTILERRTVDVLCEKLGLTERLKEIDRKSKSMEAYEVSARIAKLFSGVKASRMEEIFDTITLVRGAREFVDFLKKREFVTAIVTDSYMFLASRLARKLGIDAIRGNELELISGVVTGKITMPLGWKEEKQENCQRKAVCKLHVMNDLIRQYSIQNNKTLAVGDSQNDFCIIQKARIGVAFRPKDESIVEVPDVVVQTDFYALIEWLKDFLDRLNK
ncbi:HAD-IB family phosphatase [Candidatus Bathyarchaeota archaeon]|nr:HAD-IB family phosphatase [Candidatus Bathyarchaeota archaeon]